MTLATATATTFGKYEEGGRYKAINYNRRVSGSVVSLENDGNREPGAVRDEAVSGHLLVAGEEEVAKEVACHLWSQSGIKQRR